MGRDFKKEYEWKKKKYEEVRAQIDKDLGLSLKKKLKEQNKTIAGWITDNAKKYLEESCRGDVVGATCRGDY